MPITMKPRSEIFMGRSARLAGQCLLLLLMACASFCARAEGTAGRVYLTFDDGPIDITLAILDVLKAEEIEATFFVNAIHLDGRGGEREDRAREALRRIVAEGHVLGNHSYDHMAHNRPPGVYAIGAAKAYRDVETDLPYFLAMNIEPINAALGASARHANNQITRLARLPYANVWLFPDLDRLCPWCDARGHAVWHPDARARADIEVSEAGGRLAEALQRQHRIHSFGWDVQWMPIDWSSPVSNETLPNETAIENQIAALLESGRYCIPVLPGEYCKAPVRAGRVVVLMHDFLFENGARGRGEDINMQRLINLIRALKARGYRLETMDHYLD